MWKATAPGIERRVDLTISSFFLNELRSVMCGTGPGLKGKTDFELFTSWQAPTLHPAQSWGLPQRDVSKKKELCSSVGGRQEGKGGFLALNRTLKCVTSFRGRERGLGSHWDCAASVTLTILLSPHDFPPWRDGRQPPGLPPSAPGIPGRHIPHSELLLQVESRKLSFRDLPMASRQSRPQFKTSELNVRSLPQKM